MPARSFRITIRKIEPPFSQNAEEEFAFLCRSLGFFEEIDKEKTASAIFRLIVKNYDKGKRLTSTDLAALVKMSRGSVINHLNNLITAGLVLKDGRYYVPRSRSVYRTITEIEEDIDRVFRRMQETAKRIDREFGLRLE
ncbi:MAG: ArsR family transcriptional regulator [Candidatus Diapherotrites archaeon]|nr:ArsR family transcriptional regulator [Candidatus Diapherotrites archaeon]